MFSGFICLLLPGIFWSGVLTYNYLQDQDKGGSNEMPWAGEIRRRAHEGHARA